VLTFEIKKSGDEIEVHCDHDGLQALKEQLDFLMTQSASMHVHLATPSWAGNELTEEPQGVHGRLIHQVTIHLWKK
jgi:hypothetical protein